MTWIDGSPRVQERDRRVAAATESVRQQAVKLDPIIRPNLEDLARRLWPDREVQANDPVADVYVGGVREGSNSIVPTYHVNGASCHWRITILPSPDIGSTLTFRIDFDHTLMPTGISFGNWAKAQFAPFSEQRLRELLIAAYLDITRPDREW